MNKEPFKHANVCYKRAYKLLNWMGQNGYVTIRKKAGKPIGCTPSAEMNQLVTALNQGDEETIKAFLINPDYINVAHS